MNRVFSLLFALLLLLSAYGASTTMVMKPKDRPPSPPFMERLALSETSILANLPESVLLEILEFLPDYPILSSICKYFNRVVKSHSLMLASRRLTPHDEGSRSLLKYAVTDKGHQLMKYIQLQAPKVPREMIKFIVQVYVEQNRAYPFIMPILWRTLHAFDQKTIGKILMTNVGMVANSIKDRVPAAASLKETKLTISMIFLRFFAETLQFDLMDRMLTDYSKALFHKLVWNGEVQKERLIIDHFSFIASAYCIYSPTDKILDFIGKSRSRAIHEPCLFASWRYRPLQDYEDFSLTIERILQSAPLPPMAAHDIVVHQIKILLMQTEFIPVDSDVRIEMLVQKFQYLYGFELLNLPLFRLILAIRMGQPIETLAQLAEGNHSFVCDNLETLLTVAMKDDRRGVVEWLLNEFTALDDLESPIFFKKMHALACYGTKDMMRAFLIEHALVQSEVKSHFSSFVYISLIYTNFEAFEALTKALGSRVAPNLTYSAMARISTDPDPRFLNHIQSLGLKISRVNPKAFKLGSCSSSIAIQTPVIRTDSYFKDYRTYLKIFPDLTISKLLEQIHGRSNGVDAYKFLLKSDILTPKQRVKILKTLLESRTDSFAMQFELLVELWKSRAILGDSEVSETVLNDFLKLVRVDLMFIWAFGFGEFDLASFILKYMIHIAPRNSYDIELILVAQMNNLLMISKTMRTDKMSLASFIGNYPRAIEAFRFYDTLTARELFEFLDGLYPTLQADAHKHILIAITSHLRRLLPFLTSPRDFLHLIIVEDERDWLWLMLTATDVLADCKILPWMNTVRKIKIESSEDMYVVEAEIVTANTETQNLRIIADSNGILSLAN